MTRRRRLLAAVLLAAGLLAGCAAPPRPPGMLGAVQGSGSQTLAAQLARLRDDPAPPQARRVIFVGAALHSREDVFDRDVALLDAVLRPIYGEAYRSVRLSNVRLYEGERALPLATVEHLDEVFDTLAEQRRPNDRYLVLLSSHGGPGILQLEQPARWQPPWRMLDKTKVAEWAQRLAPQPSWLIISACFGGSHLRQPLPEHLIGMAAAAPDRASFGCANTERNTWFVQALATALQAAQPPGAESLDTLWQRTLAEVSRLETVRRVGPPSQPLSWVGPQMTGRFHAAVADF